MLSLYMDQQVPAGITNGLRRRGIDVLTVMEDGHATASDAAILQRATVLGRVVFTRDEDFLAIGRQAQASGATFSGIVYAHQLQVTIGQAVRELELICNVLSPPEMQNEIQFLPL